MLSTESFIINADIALIVSTNENLIFSEGVSRKRLRIDQGYKGPPLIRIL